MLARLIKYYPKELTNYKHLTLHLTIEVPYF